MRESGVHGRGSTGLSALGHRNPIRIRLRVAAAVAAVAWTLLLATSPTTAAEPPAKAAAKPSRRADAKADAKAATNDVAKPPAPLDLITVRPADASLKPIYVINKDGDGEGEELPPSILYVPDEKDLHTSMTITDRRLCKRKDEKAICKAFETMIDGKLPKLGTEVNETRIGGSGYVTTYLAPLTGIDYPGVDRFVAFLGSDSQDPPLGDLVVYLYARKGTALIQLSTKIGECSALPKKGESDEAYYRRNCLGRRTVKAAGEKGTAAAVRFAQAP